MLGIAQRSFKAKIGRTPWNQRRNTSRRPFLENMLSTGCIAYADYALAHTLLKLHPDSSENVAVLICHLSRAAKEGHLCIRFDGESVHPHPEDLWQNSDEESNEDINQVHQMIMEGLHEIPDGLLFTEEDVDVSRPLCKWNNFLYFQKYWLYEKKFIESIQRMESASPLLSIDVSKVKSKINQLSKDNKLLPEQAEAIKVACCSRLTIISGGPGTGKTYTAGHLIRILLESLTHEQRDLCKIVLAAPTGKAAANLHQSMQRSLLGLQYDQIIEAKTLHALLLNNNAESYISANFILVDESSMIDAKMMAKLFSAVRPGATIILLGDRYQLPPVETGSIFADLLVAKSKDNNVVEFSQCVRADIQSIVTFSKEINNGNLSQVLNILRGPDESIRICDLVKSSKLIDYITPIYEKITCDLSDLSIALENFNKFRVLTPLRKGPFGVDTLNHLVMQRLEGKLAIIPIIITKNDYNLELFNGATGILIKKDPRAEKLQKGDLAVFSDGKGGVRKVPAILVKHFEPAYCMSIHKSQGSEFDDVLVLLPEGSACFGREVLYTAVTRAKQSIELWCDEDVLEATLKNVSERVSGIVDRVSNVCGKL